MRAPLPTLLTQACVRTLSLSGAGLSVLGSLRLPLGSSDSTAALAEHAQATLGSGPCLTCQRVDDPLPIDEATIARDWPMFHAEMTTRTPYRSVLSVYVMLGAHDGALDLFSADPSATSFPRSDEVTSVIAPITKLMEGAPIIQDRIGQYLPNWLVTHRIEARLDVWIAVGMIMGHRGATASDALALLRAYAFSHTRWLDHVAHDLLEGRLNTADI